MSDQILLDKCLNFHLHKSRANNNCRNYSCQDVVDACAAQAAQIAALEAEVERLKEEIDVQTGVLKRLPAPDLAPFVALAEAVKVLLACRHGDEDRCGCRQPAIAALGDPAVERAVKNA